MKKIKITKRPEKKTKKKKASFSFKKYFKKLKKKALKFSSPLRKMKNSKLLNSSIFTRVIIIAFFFGLNVVLLPFFLKTNRVRLPKEITHILDKAGIVTEKELEYYVEFQGVEDESSLEPLVLLEKLNIERNAIELDELDYSSKLASVAADILLIAKEYDYDISNVNLNAELKESLDNAKYDFSYVSQNMVVGPRLEQAVIDAWFSDDQQIAAIQSDEFVDVGYATEIVDFGDDGVLGVVVQVLGTPRGVKPAAIQNEIKSTISPFVDVSDQEVVEALNSYRSVYDARALKVDENLCKYAEKRVGDLLAYGGLDNHDGFKSDFANDEQPIGIKDFSGDKIAENLAFQHCRNMTTGDAFYANTGTSLIEWCFDSSTAGHKEAQRNKDFSNVCVRHGENMYVVIFGN